MKNKWLKGILPLVILVIGFAAMATIEASGEKDENNEPVDIRPTVKIETAIAEDYQVRITSYGEVRPLESTMVSALSCSPWQLTQGNPSSLGAVVRCTLRCRIWARTQTSQ